MKVDNKSSNRAFLTLHRYGSGLLAIVFFSMYLAAGSIPSIAKASVPTPLKILSNCTEVIYFFQNIGKEATSDTIRELRAISDALSMNEPCVLHKYVNGAIVSKEWMQLKISNDPPSWRKVATWDEFENGENLNTLSDKLDKNEDSSSLRYLYLTTSELPAPYLKVFLLYHNDTDCGSCAPGSSGSYKYAFSQRKTSSKMNFYENWNDDAVLDSLAKLPTRLSTWNLRRLSQRCKLWTINSLDTVDTKANLIDEDQESQPDGQTALMYKSNIVCPSGANPRIEVEGRWSYEVYRYRSNPGTLMIGTSVRNHYGWFGVPLVVGTVASVLGTYFHGFDGKPISLPGYLQAGRFDFSVTSPALIANGLALAVPSVVLLIWKPRRYDLKYQRSK